MATKLSDGVRSWEDVWIRVDNGLAAESIHSGKTAATIRTGIVAGPRRKSARLWEGARLVYLSIQGRLGSAGYENVYDFTDAFNNNSSPIYADEMHVVGAGNQRLAEMIYAVIQTRLRGNIPNRTSQHAKDQITTKCSGISR